MSEGQLLIWIRNKTSSLTLVFPVFTPHWATTHYKWHPKYKLLISYFCQTQFTIFYILCLLNNMFRSDRQCNTLRRYLGMANPEGMRNNIRFALRFKKNIFVLVGISLSSIGFSNLTYCWATFLVQCLQSVSELLLRCLPVLTKASAYSFSLECPKGTRGIIPVQSHCPFLMKAFRQRYLQTWTLSHKNIQNTAPSQLLGSTENIINCSCFLGLKMPWISVWLAVEGSPSV